MLAGSGSRSGDFDRGLLHCGGWRWTGTPGQHERKYEEDCR
jgi:hypothetical protein